MAFLRLSICLTMSRLWGACDALAFQPSDVTERSDTGHIRAYVVLIQILRPVTADILATPDLALPGALLAVRVAS